MALVLIVCCMGLISLGQGMFLTRRTYTQTLTVPNGGPWGSWRDISFCPIGYFAVGYEMKVFIYLFKFICVSYIVLYQFSRID